MKRSPMPPRKEWMKGSALRSSKPSATGETQPAKPRRSMGKHVGVNKARELVKARSGGQCEIHMLGCYVQATDWHHRVRQSQGGKWHVQNGLHACRFCHEAVTNTRGHRPEYEANGWMVHSRQDPATVEVLLWHYDRHDWFLLLPDGSVELSPWPEGETGHPDDLGVIAG